MERSRLINKWMGDAQMSRATDVEKNRFQTMLDCMTDIELARPYIIEDSIAGKSLNELAIKYKFTKRQVWRIINCYRLGNTKEKKQIMGK